jgi:hypothetical protein
LGILMIMSIYATYTKHFCNDVHTLNNALFFFFSYTWIWTADLLQNEMHLWSGDNLENPTSAALHRRPCLPCLSSRVHFLLNVGC